FTVPISIPGGPGPPSAARSGRRRWNGWGRGRPGGAGGGGRRAPDGGGGGGGPGGADVAPRSRSVDGGRDGATCVRRCGCFVGGRLPHIQDDRVDALGTSDRRRRHGRAARADAAAPLPG